LPEKVPRGLERLRIGLVPLAKRFNINLGDSQLAAELEGIRSPLICRQVVTHILGSEERGPVDCPKWKGIQEQRSKKE
jgi:hypothetical protein